MPDIVMTQVPGTTHHYHALITVDPDNLNPTVDLFNYLDEDGNLHKVTDAIIQDPFVEETIEGEFEAQTTSVKGCDFVDATFQRTFDSKGHVTAMSIGLDITTVSPVVEQDAIDMKFEFLHSLGR